MAPITAILSGRLRAPLLLHVQQMATLPVTCSRPQGAGDRVAVCCAHTASGLLTVWAVDYRSLTLRAWSSSTGGWLSPLLSRIDPFVALANRGMLDMH